MKEGQQEATHHTQKQVNVHRAKSNTKSLSKKVVPSGSHFEKYGFIFQDATEQPMSKTGTAFENNQALSAGSQKQIVVDCRRERSFISEFQSTSDEQSGRTQVRYSKTSERSSNNFEDKATF